ncbi:metallophosphoesterase family protein [Candidatus Micrarchaeota archaeon]|nr:metallophosphoesterase family protein [Candidatus Micrarchaeota archaeon]
MVELKFLHNEPALLAGRRLVVADLHLGLERELLAREETVSFTIELKEKIIRLVEETKAEKLLLLGDVKHAVLKTSEREWVELKEFFKELSKRVQVEVVKGNHDGGIERVVGSEVRVFEANGFCRKGDARGGKLASVFEASGFCDELVGFCHGQAWPDARLWAQDYIIIGHEHPAVEFVDEVGGKSVRKAWVVGGIDVEKARGKYVKARGKLRTGKNERNGLQGEHAEINEDLQVVVMPAFNDLVCGSAFNSSGFKGIGPLFENNVFKLSDAKVFLLDGTSVGSVESLRKKE